MSHVHWRMLHHLALLLSWRAAIARRPEKPLPMSVCYGGVWPRPFCPPSYLALGIGHHSHLLFALVLECLRHVWREALSPVFRPDLSWGHLGIRCAAFRLISKSLRRTGTGAMASRVRVPKMPR